MSRSLLKPSVGFLCRLCSVSLTHSLSLELEDVRTDSILETSLAGTLVEVEDIVPASMHGHSRTPGPVAEWD